MPRINNEKFYTSALVQHGVSAKGLNWHSKEYQQIRFKIILEMLPSSLREFSITDAGCGFGDFYLYLQKRKKIPNRYVGIDCVEESCHIAAQQTVCEIISLDICHTKESHLFPKTSYYICSGAMNILNSFETHLFIRNCYEASEFGFIFNILHGDKQNELFNYLSTKQIKKIASDLNVKRVILKDGYLEDDITVGFFK